MTGDHAPPPYIHKRTPHTLSHNTLDKRPKLMRSSQESSPGRKHGRLVSCRCMIGALSDRSQAYCVLDKFRAVWPLETIGCHGTAREST